MNNNELFRCRKCGELKSIEEYYTKDTKLGRDLDCKGCYQARVKEIRKIKKEGICKIKKREIINDKTTCSNCRQLKSINEFYKQPTSIGISYRCKECMLSATKNIPNYQEKKQKYDNERKKQFFDMVNQLKSLPCMDFDHVRNIKENDVHEMKGCKVEKIINEIDKCDLVCSNCHRIRTAKRRLEAQAQNIDEDIPNKVYKNKQRKSKNRDIVHRIKSQACTLCQICFDPYAMDFDHLDPTQKINNVSQMIRIGYGIDKILKEIDKCQLLCSNCHRMVEYSRREKNNINIPTNIDLFRVIGIVN